MTRRGRLQRSLITVLALLMVTPQVLLRPCCCAGQRTEAAADSKADNNLASLPPCCQKRLQSARKTSAPKPYGNAANSSRSGLHDSGRCVCRIKTEVARTSRAIFKALAERQIEIGTSASVVSSDRQTILDRVLLTTAYFSPPDWGAEQSERLCRWLV